MTEFPSFFVIAVTLIHVAVSILVLYCVCRRHTCCRNRRRNPTSQDIDMTVVQSADACTPEGNDLNVMYRLSGISGISSRNSGCYSNNNTENDTENDPGMGHIYRFLGRSVSEEGNVYDSETDVGVRHIRRALGITADELTDPGVVHVRRALGLRAGDCRGSQSDTALSQSTSNTNDNSDQSQVRSNSQINNIGLAGQSAQEVIGERRISQHRYSLQSDDNIPEDDPPTYQEALAILARADEDFPPSYDDAVNTPNMA